MNARLSWWIEATDAQRAALVRQAEEGNEAVRRTPHFQASLREYIADLEAKIAAKQAELANGGYARRLNRQIAALQDDLDFQKTEIR